MGKVYINIHPDYDYATVMFQGWTNITYAEMERQFPHFSAGPVGQSIITGDNHEKGAHIKYIPAFIDAMKQCGNTVYVRNSRGDQWSIK